MNFNKSLKVFVVFFIIFAWLLNSFPLKAADGSGTNVVDPITATASASGKTFDFLKKEVTKQIDKS